MTPPKGKKTGKIPPRDESPGGPPVRMAAAGTAAGFT
jgi:hypothetical protein